MKFFISLICSMFFVAQACASTFDIGLKGGWTHSNMDNTSIVSEGNEDTAMYGAYFEWNATDWFALGTAYNAFGNQSITTPIKEQDLSVHGPEVYAKLTYHFDQSDLGLFVRGGAMYAFADGEGDLADSNRLAPVVGVGAQWQVFPFFGLRVGYDRYFRVYESNYKTGNVESDFSTLYLGANYTF